MKKDADLVLCGYCAAAPLNSGGGGLSHRLCSGVRCACADNGHIVTEEIAAVQRKYTLGYAERYHAKRNHP